MGARTRTRSRPFGSRCIARSLKMSELVIGVDAGGTRTRAAVANARGEMLGTGEAGAGNPHQNGTESAQHEILGAIQRACNAARVDQGAIAAACLGVAGIDRADERIVWRDWAREKICARVQ